MRQLLDLDIAMQRRADWFGNLRKLWREINDKFEQQPARNQQRHDRAAGDSDFFHEFHNEICCDGGKTSPMSPFRRNV